MPTESKVRRAERARAALEYLAANADVDEYAPIAEIWEDVQRRIRSLNTRPSSPPRDAPAASLIGAGRADISPALAGFGSVQTIDPSTADSHVHTGTPMTARTDLSSTSSMSALMPSGSRQSP